MVAVDSTKCPALFCIAERHDDDKHVDATGYVWEEPTPDHTVIAHMYYTGSTERTRHFIGNMV